MIDLKSNSWETDIYAQNLQVNSWPYSEVISEVKRNYPGNELNGKKIAEIGCGTGNNLLFFGKENCQIFGLDFSKSAIEKANKLLESQSIFASLHCGDVTKPLPWEDNSIDIFLDRGCLTQVSFNEIPSILFEVKRVLKKGGKFFSFTLFGDDSDDLIFGTEIEKNTYDHFNSGYFQKIGKTSVYNETLLNSLLKDFQILKLMKNHNIDLLQNKQLSTYSFVACRQN